MDIRIYQNRKNINIIKTVEGKEAETDAELVIERRYAEEHDIEIEDSLVIGDAIYAVVGIGCRFGAG